MQGTLEELCYSAFGVPELKALPRKKGKKAEICEINVRRSVPSRNADR